MSYILDALKRADAERGRGAVPGLHTRQMTSPAALASPSTGRYAGLAAVAVVALGGIAAGAWFWQTPARPVQLAAVEPAAGTQLAAPAPPLAQPASAQPPVQASAPEAAPLTGAAAPPIPAPAAPSAPVTAPMPALKPAVAAPPRAVSSPAPVAPAAAQKTVSKPPPAPAAGELAPPPKPRLDPVPVAKASPAPAAQAAPSAIPLLSELPDNIRRQLPPLVINGSVYSNNPGQRLLLVNNLVLPQGAQAAPEVTLEEIRPKSSVFSFRGQRFQLAH